VSGQHSADSVEYSPFIGQEDDSVRFIIGPTDVRTTVENSVDLPVVTVLPENVPQDYQIRM
jgi:predicted transcriptional regulator